MCVEERNWLFTDIFIRGRMFLRAQRALGDALLDDSSGFKDVSHHERVQPQNKLLHKRW